MALWGAEPLTDCPKDGIDRAVVHGDESATRPGHGTKVAFWWQFDLAPGETRTVRLRLSAVAAGIGRGHAFFDAPSPGGFTDFDRVMTTRRAEADDFYRGVIPASAGDEDTHVARRAFAGLLWGKQLYR